MIDCLFIPHNRYHALEMVQVYEELKRRGLHPKFLCIDRSYKHNYSTEKILKEKGVSYLLSEVGIIENLRPRSIFVMNDWGGVVHDYVLRANELNIITIGAVEGINDFEDLAFIKHNQGRRRNPYKTVKNLLVTGNYDTNFFTDKNVYLTGIPRMEELFAAKPVFPDRHLVAVNCNFTYGIYEEYRNKWLEDIVGSLSELALDYVVTQHPADESDLSSYNLFKGSFHSLLGMCSLLITRFSGCVLESLALGKPVVYYDNYNEAMDKFKNPMGAYHYVTDKSTLKSSVQDALETKELTRAKAKMFLDYHVTYDAEYSCIERTADAIIQIIT